MSTPPDQKTVNSPSSPRTKRYGWYGGLVYNPPPRRDSDQSSSITEIRSSVETLMEHIQQDRINNEAQPAHNSHTLAVPDATNPGPSPRPNSPHESQMSSGTVIHNRINIPENETGYISDVDTIHTLFEGEALSRCTHHASRPESQPASTSGASLGRFTENFETEHTMISQEAVKPVEGKTEGHHQQDTTTAAEVDNKPRPRPQSLSLSQRNRRRRRSGLRPRGWFSRFRRGFMARFRGVRGKSSPRREEGGGGGGGDRH